MPAMSLDFLLKITGDLVDDGASARFRVAIENSSVSQEDLERLIKECLEKSGKQFNKALQDIVNAVGKRLGFDVDYGLYKGKPNAIGYDGLWKSPATDKNIVVEVKTTGVYAIEPDTVTGYISKLVKQGEGIGQDNTFGLYVVGSDWKKIETQIRGSQQVNRLRLISCAKLLRLLRLKQDSGLKHEQIVRLMLPFDNINIGNMLNVIESIISVQVKEEVETSETKKTEVVEQEGKRRRTHHEDFRIPLLEALVEMGGRGRTSDVCNRIETKMRSRLTSGDYEKFNGRVIWKKRVHRIRGKLAKSGLLRPDSPQGIWEISDEGRAYLEKVKKEG